MKTTGIVAAMDMEMELLKNEAEIAVTKNAVGKDYYIGNLHGKSVVLVKCGVGKVNAAVATQALIDLFAVDCVINTGVAGGIYNSIKIGDIVISADAVQHDFDASPLGIPAGVIPWMEESVFKADDTLVDFAKRAVSELGLDNGRGVYTARIASGDTFVADRGKKKEIWNNTGAYCVEMEGAAIAQTCALNKIPFVIIRSTSDNADETSTNDFKLDGAAAAEVSASIIKKIIEYI